MERKKQNFKTICMIYRHNYYIDKIEYKNIKDYRLLETSKLLAKKKEITNT
jgi:hypothetical protein